ncbi:hypothetical protein SMD44_07307 [Streptomyces alboflavus]|uniref:Uncharacterized protein n=1 Tax=Streptomyces alboflavus TaxID=67267 RepID=A0A1Z1WMZ8_9ACTN|nr:hypothetical protein SMD44_07307 [Streptomyces alboflavus]
MAAQDLRHVRRLLAGTAQVHREGRAEAALLAVARGALGEEQVEGVVDLVAGAGRRAGVARDGHGDAGEDQALGEDLEEAVVADAAGVAQDRLAGLAGHRGGEAVDVLAALAGGQLPVRIAEMLESASPMPERTKRTGASRMTSRSMTTAIGFGTP